MTADSSVEAQLTEALADLAPLFREHRPVGAYLPLGQLDNDCRCGRGGWPCPTLAAVLVPVVAQHVEDALAEAGLGKDAAEIRAKNREHMIEAARTEGRTESLAKQFIALPEPNRSTVQIALAMNDTSKQNLTEAIKDVCWKATQYGETEDGDTYAYIVPKGAMHRLIGAAQGAGIPAAFRSARAEGDTR